MVYFCVIHTLRIRITCKMKYYSEIIYYVTLDSTYLKVFFLTFLLNDYYLIFENVCYISLREVYGLFK